MSDAATPQNGIPTVDEAERLLGEAARMNRGPWEDHSRYVGDAAARIAECHPDLDPTRARVPGLLHDIGRREGVHHLRHVTDGYHHLMKLGYPPAARICLSHSLPVPDIECFAGRDDCGEEDRQLIVEFLVNARFDEYDKLLQLCDFLAVPAGFCLLETRTVDVALRYGTTARLVEQWRSVFEIKHALEDAIGPNVYSLLPGVVETTFDLTLPVKPRDDKPPSMA